ncbi:helix-turn-helix domain-containing protein [Arthrobacter sp. Br18]|uniref:helix-turn-helix domain-containing protein n=1 Tax=Arthrobacter sp. Br18 TaxID=1312954 RepID=UPI0004B6A170|nr:helix-turn-helix domain-containing protein [Arthrobacter sp. Br18]
MSSIELPRDLLTVAEVAGIMRVSRMTVYRLLQSGALTGVRFGRSYRVSESALQQYLQSFTPQHESDQRNAERHSRAS